MSLLLDVLQNKTEVTALSDEKCRNLLLHVIRDFRAPLVQLETQYLQVKASTTELEVVKRESDGRLR